MQVIKNIKQFITNQKNVLKAVMCIILLTAMYILGGSAGTIQVNNDGEKCFVVAVDPGHGGNDPGKTVGDIYEKDINLSIAIKLKAVLEKNGIKVVITRDTDTGLYGETDSNKKIADMKNRCRLINESNADILVSIHQNSYSAENVKGAQVFFYEHSKEGEKLAGILQSTIKSRLDKENERQHKANDSYYILLNVEMPAVIVECGFLTNPDECKKLLDENYQNEMAQAVAEGIVEYMKGTDAQGFKDTGNTIPAD